MTSMTGRPAYLQITDGIKRKIETGQLVAGDKLPSMAELCREYSVSNTVIRDVLNELRRAGLVVGQQGKGVYVRDDADVAGNRDELAASVERLASEVASLSERVARLESSRR